MWNVRISQSPLPYAIFITKIIEHFGVSLDGETKVALNLHERKIYIEVVHKMEFVIDPVTRRTYKHHTDRQTAPTDQPEPTAPNQLEFQAPSSSSSAMPSNKMIMDELTHNSKRKGEHIYMGSILKTSHEISPEGWDIQPDSRLSERVSPMRETQCFEFGNFGSLAQARNWSML
ncbi:hypothetical protein Lal_00015282 [Lupinus albus]|nr:hypothetical protein Lal_00015282 [Lupinus albus]